MKLSGFVDTVALVTGAGGGIGTALVRQLLDSGCVVVATDDARILWRSGGMKVEFVDPIEVEVNGQRRRMGDLLTYKTDLARDLHAQCRVHTYGSFHIADLSK